MNLEPEGGQVEARAPAIAGARLNSIKQVSELSYLDDAPENAVVLSDRLRRLIGEVGGCQTSQVEAVIRRVIYEILFQKNPPYKSYK